jgi:hypothetical protein
MRFFIKVLKMEEEKLKPIEIFLYKIRLKAELDMQSIINSDSGEEENYLYILVSEDKDGVHETLEYCSTEYLIDPENYINRTYYQ